MEKEKTENKAFETGLTKVNDMYLPLITRQLENNNIVMNEYAKRCVINSIASINQMLANQGISWNDKSLDHSNITQILLNVASLELNPTAEPSECYFQIRNQKRKTANGGEEWKKIIEFGIQAGGNDVILSKFGRNVKKVYPCWLVREGDEFKYPSYKGVEYTPPEWNPTGGGKVIRVVYPILHNDNSIHYYIGERADVANNLLAHINNNMMNETFGICKDRYKATQAELEKIAEKKAEIKAKAKALGLDALDDEEIAKYISPAWKEDFSRETMIIRKMMNNVVKKIPKDFSSSVVQEAFIESTSEEYKFAKENIIEHTAVIEVDDIKELDTSSAADLQAESGEQEQGGKVTPPTTEKPLEAANDGQFEMNMGTRTKPDFLA